MKIAVLTTYFDPEENGLTRYINGLYGALLEKHPEIEVDVITFDTLRTKKYVETHCNASLHCWNIYRIDCLPILNRTYAIPTIKGFRQLKEIFRRKTPKSWFKSGDLNQKILEKSGSGLRPEPTSSSYDIINTHTRFFLTSYYGIKMGKKYGIPVIHTEHGSDFVKHRSKIIELIARLYDLTLGKYVLKNADLVCGVSQSACRFAKKLGAKKAEVIYNGIDTKFWKVVSRQSSVVSNKVTFTFVGRLIPEKGVQDLIEVLKDINTPPPANAGYSSQEENDSQSPLERGGSASGGDGVCEINWKLLIIGDGFYRKELEKLVKKYKLEDKIFFLGAKSQKEIRGILNITDLFINPSIASEGLPTTILEAAACNCRVISSDKGGSVEALGEENLYPAGNLKELARKILDYQKIPVPEVEKFDWKKISEKYWKTLMDIKKKAPKPEAESRT